MRTILLLLLCACIYGQSPNMTLTDQNPTTTTTPLNFYDGSGNQIYQCRAYSYQPIPSVFSVANGLLTNIVVSSNVGTVTTTGNHGYQVGNPFTASGSATSSLNRSYTIQTVGSATTFTITTTGVSNGTYTDVVLQTNAPSSNAPIWSVWKKTYSGSNWLMTQWHNSGSYSSQCSSLYPSTTILAALSWQ